MNTPANPRRWERQPKTILINLVLKGDHLISDSSAFTLDISLGGASVRTKFALVPGERVEVVPKGELTFIIPARTVWVREDDYKWTFAGLEFLDISLALGMHSLMHPSSV
jgi:c-di-GMP-binding flagellar brake protein YcgR